MQIKMIKSKVSEAIAHEEQTGFLAQLLTKLCMDQGVSYDSNQIAQSVNFIRTSVELVPNILEEFIKAAKEYDALDDIRPFLEAAEECFLSIQDGIPDNMGLVGLMDNAYLVHSLIISIPGITKEVPGVLEFHNVLRNSIGEPIVSQLDVIVNSILNKPDVQMAIQKIASLPEIPPTVDNSPKKPFVPVAQNRPQMAKSEAAGIATKGGNSEKTYITSVVPVRVASIPGQKLKAVQQTETEGSEAKAESEGSASMPSYLDSTFGSSGKVITNLQDGTAKALSIQADGKIVVAGYSNNNQGYSSFTLARYNTDGRLDSTFGGSGCLRLESDRPSKARALAMQADGKIVVAGEVARLTDSEEANFNAAGNWKNRNKVEARELDITDPRVFDLIDFALARLNSNGSLDPSFGRNGWTHLKFFDGSSKAYAVIVQEDGKILVGGYAQTDHGCFALARFNPNGDLDSSFGRGGLVIDERGGLGDHVYAIALQADGKIVAAGTIGVNRKSGKFALARFNSEGDPDSTFGDEGLVIIELGGQNAWVNAIAVQDDGKIVAAGCLKNPLEKFVLIRCDSDGNLDNTFGNGGIALAEFVEPKSCATSVALQKDDKILVAGWAGDDVPDPNKMPEYNAPKPTVLKSAFALARYKADGCLDSNFGSDGMLTTEIGSSSDVASAVAVNSNGKIVAVEGIRKNTYPNNIIAVQSDGKILATGGGGSFALARYLNISRPSPSSAVVPNFPSRPQNPKVEPDSERVSEMPGDLDLSFGKGGSGLIIDVDNAEARAIAIQPDGKILVAGYIDTGQKPTFVDFVVARYNSDGSPDSKFHDTGITTLDFNGDDERAYAIALQEDGKIILAGEAINIDNSSFDFALVRLNPDGIVDRTFGNDGVVLTDFVNASYDSAQALVLQADGKIVVAGFMATFKDGELQTQNFALARYNTDGKLDTSFGSDGKVTTDFAGGFNRAQSVAIQEDGNIVVAGVMSVAGSEITDFGLVRYNPDGVLDSSFGKEGKVTTDFGKNENIAYALVIQADGKILAGGYTASESTKVAALARFNADGTLDPTFGDCGKVIGLFGGKDDGINAIVLQADSKILVVGYALAFEDSEAQTQDFALVRLNSDGRFDTSFGIGGIVMTDFSGMNDIAYAVSLQSNGKIVVAGTTDTGSNKSFAIASYLNTISQSSPTPASAILKSKVNEKRADRKDGKKRKSKLSEVF